MINKYYYLSRFRKYLYGSCKWNLQEPYFASEGLYLRKGYSRFYTYIIKCFVDTFIAFILEKYRKRQLCYMV